jgi:hypothetical protein
MRASLFALLGAAVILVAMPARAHHSFPAFYDESQSVTVEGELVSFEYRSPHAWVHVRARDAKGQMQTFAAEWSGPSRLAHQHITQDTLRAGDHVIVTGAPGRNPAEHHLHLKRIERPSDGWRWEGMRRDAPR